MAAVSSVKPHALLAAATSTMPAALEVSNLSKRYGAIEAVRAVSFNLPRGEIFGLLGLNGAGKTTTLECILGLRRLDTGSILLDGVDLSAQPTEARRRVGAQLQADALQDKITPRQALRLFASFYRGASRPDELLARFGLSAKADAPFDSLSGGQKQRLFLALAFVPAAPLLVLDEPTAGLDPGLRRELHTHIAAEKGAGRSVLLSTHDLNEAEHLCDRVGLLHEGRLVALGAPSELIARASVKPKVALRTARPLASAEFAAWPQLRKITEKNGEWLFDTADVNETLNLLLALVGRQKNSVVDLRIQHLTLEDVFLELTGQPWVEPVAPETE